MDFDRVAVVYRSLERLVYGGALQRARLAHLDFSGAPRVLVLGDGDGRFLAELLVRVPAAQVDVVEASGKMIALAQRRVPAAAAVKFHHLRVEEFEPAGRYDVVASHFFLDCFDEDGIRRVVQIVAACLEAGGEWLMADFQEPRRGWLRRFRARLLLWVMYRFFSVAAGLRVRHLVDPAPVLERSGFSLAKREVSNLGFLRADRWQLNFQNGEN